ncbi:G-type lectin S-receptor-like serine/threonine-protein kinase [Arachis hypogaea]|nr:G-type lectin S-receptor-like serine/threonine-protein kinase [Arachis hypogaea]
MDILNSMIIVAYLLLVSSVTVSSAKVSSVTVSMAVNDSIGMSKSISDDGNDKTIVSKDGVFELGFFSPGSSMKRYLGIWYKKSSMYTVVWVANRDKPIDFVSAGILTLDITGNLILTQNDSVVWSTNSQRQAQNPVAQLMDSGNLVVWNDGGPNSEDILWQSFDYPSDTILPGMKVGWDLKRGLEWRITSWKSPNDPAPGDFSWGLVLNEYPDFYMKGRTRLNRFGPWNGLYFSGFRDQNPSSVYEFTYVTSYDAKFPSNKDEIYYTYTLKNTSILSRVHLDQTGGFHFYIWAEEDQQNWELYEMYSSRDQCFSPKSPQEWDMRNWTKGCVRTKPLTCNDISINDIFVKFVALKVPDTTHTWLDENIGLDECRARCLNNCSCMAFSNSDIRGSGSGCVLWFGDLIDMRQFNTKQTREQDLYIRMANAESQSESKMNIRTIVAITIPTLCGVLLLSVYVVYRIRRNLVEKSMVRDNIEKHVEDLPLFALPTISMATSNFWIENKIGQGGFGPVYKGKLSDGRQIAVKRLSRSSGQGVTEFINEVKLIAKLQHRNLVRLLGCCIQGQEKLLIYEYMANGSLDSFIFDHTKGKLLSWPHRFHIILGIARGLLYLHQDSRLRIIHRDLKASNVLLDDKLNSKISDFGMAKAFGGDQTEGNTDRVVGTYGYMAPEYAVDGLFSVKSDVFSFGILLLEIICGSKNRALSYANNTYNLVGYAWTLWKEGNALQLIDSNIKDSCIDSEVLRCIQVSLVCMQHYPEDRPTMTSVIRMLDSEMELVDPKEPGFFPRKVSNEATNQNEISLNNEISVTSLDGR